MMKYRENLIFFSVIYRFILVDEKAIFDCQLCGFIKVYFGECCLVLLKSLWTNLRVLKRSRVMFSIFLKPPVYHFLSDSPCKRNSLYRNWHRWLQRLITTMLPKMENCTSSSLMSTCQRQNISQNQQNISKKVGWVSKSCSDDMKENLNCYALDLFPFNALCGNFYLLIVKQ